MLTAYQCATGAYLTEDGELLCPNCFEAGDDFAKPISNYGLDEEQTAYAEGHEWSEDGLDHSECLPALLDAWGHELVEAYHYGHDDIEPTNPPVPRWVPCGSCGARDGEPHRDGCSTLRPNQQAWNSTV